METYKVTVRYECEVDYDVPAKSQKQADEMILTKQIGAAKYTDYRQTNRKIVSDKEKKKPGTKYKNIKQKNIPE